MVTPMMSRALVVVYAPRRLNGDELTEVLDLTLDRVIEATGGVESARVITATERA